MNRTKKDHFFKELAVLDKQAFRSLVSLSDDRARFLVDGICQSFTVWPAAHFTRVFLRE